MNHTSMRDLSLRSVLALALLVVSLYGLVTFAAEGDPVVQVVPESIPGATVNTPYTATLTVTGTEAFGAVTVAGAFIEPSPLGLEFSLDQTAGSVTISGTPGASGSFAFTVDALDATSTVVASRQYVLTVTPEVVHETQATLTILTTLTNDNGGVNSASDFTVRISGAALSETSQPGNEAGANVTIPANTAYVVSTIPGSLYTAAFTPGCSGTLGAGVESTCVITLDDIAFPVSGGSTPNLISNAGLEASVEGNGLQPVDWSFRSWGTNNVTAVYHATGTLDSQFSSGAYVEVQITNHVDGDAKWYFTPVAVLPGHYYTYTNAYQANAPTEILAEFYDASGAHVAFGGWTPMPATQNDAWAQGQARFEVPTGAASMTVFHALGTNGTLAVDNANLSEIAPTQSFSTGFVTLTFDDAFTDNFTNAKPILDAANVSATFYAPTHFIGGLSVKNSDLETVDPIDDNKPFGWSTSGNTAATFTYPVAGRDSTAAAFVADTTVGGNAGWYFTPTNIFADQSFHYTSWYKSTTETEVVAYLDVRNSTSTVVASAHDEHVVYLGESIVLPSTDGVWKKLDTYFYAIPTAERMTVVHRLKGTGELTIDDVRLNALAYMGDSELRDLAEAGHEIGSHSQTHADLASLPSVDAEREIAESFNELRAGGFTGPLSLAYPFGSYSADVQQIARDAGYESARTVIPGYNGRNTDKFGLLSQSVNRDTTVAQVKTWIDTAKANRTWLILLLHGISDTPELGEDYTATPDTLRQIVNYIKTQSVPVRSMQQGIRHMGETVVSVNVAVVNTHSGTATSGDFMIMATSTDGGAQLFQGSTTGTTIALGDGSRGDAYAITAAFDVGRYAAEYTGSCNGMVPEGANLTCSITLRDLPDPTPLDTQAPVITLVGDATTTVLQNAIYADLGATVTDNVDASIVTVATGTVDTTLVGTYTVTYNASDASGNTALPVTRTVHVVAASTPAPSHGGGGGGGGSSKAVKKSFTLADFNTLMINWGKKEKKNAADFNKDGVVNLKDFNVLIINWAK